MKGKSLTETDKRNKSIAAKNRESITCVHCGVSTDPGNHKLYHGDNCKNSDIFDPTSRTGHRSQPRNHNEKTCPHCGKTGKGGNMKRYHFDNCKLNPYSNR